MAFVRNNNNNNGNRRHNNYNRHRHQSNSSQGQGNNNGQRRHVNRINQVFESNGPEGRIRGTAQQIVEKYSTMGRDAAMAGDRVLSMNYLQHAEHYQRLLNEITEENAIFEREREAQRAAQQTQPEISASDAEAGFVSTGDQPSADQPNADRPQRAERPQQRPERQERQEQRPREKRPADDVPDDELPSFLQVPIKSGAPEVETAKPRLTRARKVAPVSGEDGE